MIFRSENPDGELNGFVDAGTVFRGELQFETTFRVEGRVEGKIVSNGTLVIGEGGVVDGEIRVSQLFVSGTVRGKAHATRRLQLCKEGKAFAELETPSLVIEDGAVFDGRCTMTREAEARPADAGARPAAVQPLHSLGTRKDR